MPPYLLSGFTWLPCAACKEMFVAFFFCSRASNRRTFQFLRNRKPMIRGTRGLLLGHHPIKQQGGRRIATSVVITGKMIPLQQYKPALTTIPHYESDRCNSVLAKTLMSQSLRHLEIIFDGLPHIIAPFFPAVRLRLATVSNKLCETFTHSPLARANSSLCSTLNFILICTKENIPGCRKTTPSYPHHC